LGIGEVGSFKEKIVEFSTNVEISTKPEDYGKIKPKIDKSIKGKSTLNASIKLR
jgi:hypothetical protein